MSLDAYRMLEAQERRIGLLDSVAAMLNWDQAVMMPDGGAPARGRELAMLGVLRHELITAPGRGDLIAKAQAAAGALDRWQDANLAGIAHAHRRATALAPALVERLALARSETEFAWRKARADDDFAAVAPKLAELLSLVREEASALGDALGLDPYDALIDGYDPGLRVADFAPLFDRLAAALPPLLDVVLERQAAAGPAIALQGAFPIPAQEGLSRAVMQRLGFDFAHGRLDVSHHPFTGGGPDDVRLTTRYDESEFLQALLATIHETGHALYERGLPEAWRYQPVGEAGGMTLHESQSLIFEMQVGRNPAFLRFLAPFAAGHLGGEGPAWRADNLVRHVHQVSRGLIRVHADEITYPLHVILRFKLERALIGGTLEVADLPQAWRETMRAHLGVVPESDRDGCLQDIHWYFGAFGYFPTYTLGALAAAQLFAAAKRAHGEIMGEMEEGRTDTLLTFLRDKVHARGRSASTQEILQEATGKPLGADAFLAHLDERYLSKAPALDNAARAAAVGG